MKVTIAVNPAIMPLLITLPQITSMTITTAHVTYNAKRKVILKIARKDARIPAC
jgi:hypothetical protein